MEAVSKETMMMTLNIAHRGARSLAPENTLLAARKGLEAGADLWETDLAVTRDEQLILLHDDLLLRTTNVRQRYPDRAQSAFTTFSLTEIRALDAGSWFVNTDPFGQIGAGALSLADQLACRHVKVPTLEEALVFTLEHDWQINLELKALPSPMSDFPIVAKVLAMLDRLGFPSDRIVISSFQHRWLEEVQALDPRLKVQALIGYHEDKALTWGAMAFDTYNVRHTLADDQDIRQRRRQGIAINMFTVNKPEDMRRWLDLGVNGIITDFPQRLAAMG